MLPLDSAWTISKFIRRVDKVSDAMEHGVSFGLTADEMERRARFYRRGDALIQRAGPVDTLIEDARLEDGKIEFLVSFKCRECGRAGDHKTAPEMDLSHMQDDESCFCGNCKTVLGNWSDLRDMAAWFAEEEIRYGKVGEPVLPECVLRLPNPPAVRITLPKTGNALRSSTYMPLK